MARDDPNVRVRLPPEIKDAIQKSAHDAGRSMNAEIVWRLARDLETGDLGDDRQRAARNIKTAYSHMELAARQLRRLVEKLDD